MECNRETEDVKTGGRLASSGKFLSSSLSLMRKNFVMMKIEFYKLRKTFKDLYHKMKKRQSTSRAESPAGTLDRTYNLPGNLH